MTRKLIYPTPEQHDLPGRRYPCLSLLHRYRFICCTVLSTTPGYGSCCTHAWGEPPPRWGRGSRAAERWSTAEKSPGVTLQKSPAKLRAETTRGEAGSGQDTEGTRPLMPPQQLWQAGSPRAHSCISPSPERCTGLSYC